MHLVGFRFAGVGVGVAIKPTQFQSDETIRQRFYLGRGLLGFVIQSALGFYLGVVVGRQAFQFAAFLIRFLDVAKKICGGESDLPLAVAQAEIFNLLQLADSQQ